MSRRMASSTSSAVLASGSVPLLVAQPPSPPFARRSLHDRPEKGQNGDNQARGDREFANASCWERLPDGATPLGAPPMPAGSRLEKKWAVQGSNLRPWD